MADGKITEKELVERSNKGFEVRRDSLKGYSSAKADQPQKSAIQPNTVSPLQDLAPELRNRIYEYAVIYDKAIDIVDICGPYGDAPNAFERARNALRQPALTRTCKMFRSESLSMFYTYNSFKGSLLHLSILDTQITWKWLLAIGRQRTKLQDFTAELYGSSALTSSTHSAAEVGRQVQKIGLKRGELLTVDARHCYGTFKVNFETIGDMVLEDDEASWGALRSIQRLLWSHIRQARDAAA